MNPRVFFLTITVVVISIYIRSLINRPIIELCEVSLCPNCYGSDLCNTFKDDKIKIEYTNVIEFLNSMVSVKNVFFAKFNNNEKVVLKKLGHNNEINKFSALPGNKMETIITFLNEEIFRSFKMCSDKVSKQFLSIAKTFYKVEHLWTLLQINVEPIILKIFKNEDDWPVPKLYGSCGVLVVENHCGSTLNYFETADWHKRAFLSMQLLEAALNFTERHDDFRLYLTDISPDNIAVDENWKIRFVDLENVILSSKERTEKVHYSEFFDDVDFIYNEKEICDSSVSDHNIYAVCRLLLSKNAPWPMMKNGLLHSSPENVLSDYFALFNMIEACVYSDERISRFKLAYEIIEVLKQIIILNTG